MKPCAPRSGRLWTARNYAPGDLFRRALDAAASVAAPGVLAAAHNWVGKWHLNSERPEQARRHHGQALERFRAEGNEVGGCSGGHGCSAERGRSQVCPVLSSTSTALLQHTPGGAAPVREGRSRSATPKDPRRPRRRARTADQAVGRSRAGRSPRSGAGSARPRSTASETTSSSSSPTCAPRAEHHWSAPGTPTSPSAPSARPVEHGPCRYWPYADIGKTDWT